MSTKLGYDENPIAGYDLRFASFSNAKAQLRLLAIFIGNGITTK